MPRAASRKPIAPSIALQKRRASVEEWLVSGLSTAAVAEMAMRTLKVGRSTAMNDIAWVRERWYAESQATRATKRAETLAQTDDLYRRSLAAKELTTARSTLALKADLHGLRVRPVALAVSVDKNPQSLAAWLATLFEEPSPGAPADASGNTATPDA